MSPKNHKTFVGRETELRAFRRMVAKPYGKVRILFVLGSGGIGKTKLIERMLELKEVDKLGILMPQNPLDLSTTQLRSIDGIQSKIIEVIETLTGLKEEQSPFAEFFKDNRNTSEQFNRCLREFCKKTPLVLAFDTFEVLGTVASNWLFAEGDEGLQVPGLVCIVAGRSEKENLQRYTVNPLVKPIEISGFTIPEIEDFYQKIVAETSQGIAAAASVREEDLGSSDFRHLQKITNGHPLKLEMAFRWAGTILSTKSLVDVTYDQFEKRIMQMVRDYGADVVLDASHLDVREAAYDIFVCMGYVTRRFDQKILKFLVDEGYIRLNSDRVEEKEIIEHLERYFFVKAQTVEGEGIVLRLHDEVARLVREHLWSSPDRAEEKQRLLISVIRLYDQMIKDAEDEDLQDTLRIEQLYYALERDPLDTGKRLWLDLADLDDEYINSLLPGEIKDYKKDFDLETRHEIHVRIAEMEYEAGHITQARGEREMELELGKEAKRNDWIASALFGLANCERGAGKSLAAFQKARIFCEKHARGYLPRVYYNIGFAYRKLQDVEKAIRWYRKARKEFQKNSQDKALGAQIANDLGYAYSHVGNWGECRKNVKEGQKTRKSLLLQIEQEINILETKWRTSKSKAQKAKLHDELNRKKKRLSKARFQLGLSYNTLGEIYRYDEDLDASLSNYTEAHELFKKVNNPRWQAKSLFSRGETYRRIAWARYKEKDESGYVENIKRAEEDIQESLFLCERYRIKEERDTANRRMGRVLHDRALHELEKGNKQDARKFLEQAKYYFEQGLKYAVQTDEDLEELSNQTELAFLYDDFIRVIGRGKLPQEHRDALDNLKRALDKHRKNPFKIYQFPVFENLYKLEKAAVNYQARKYKQALKGYLEGYIGLAADPGYGRTRYKSHFSHLTRQIEKLPRREAEVWCRAFIDAWEEKRFLGGRRSTLAQEEIFPDLVQWCWEYIHTNKGRD
ncbi:MAG: hypothetical protein HND47_07755 [Chloroflexi bacterium]|nr:hypothetical protein [Chloroflexota bacterium]